MAIAIFLGFDNVVRRIAVFSR